VVAGGGAASAFGGSPSGGGGEPSSSGASGALNAAGAGGSVAGKPVDHDKASIYCAFPEIYSQSGKLSAITADLTRIKELGFSALYLLPITPRMKMAYPPHTWVNRPYSVTDYKAIDPAVGSDDDLVALVQKAHGLGMQVLLDQVLNHTAWDNDLIKSHPEYYVRSDGNPKNSASIVEPEGFPDTAQLDYKTSGDGLTAYMEDMLSYWVKTFDVDGFRFDTADNPYGPMRKITLRNSSSALRQGDFAWLDNSSAQHVVSFTRSDSSGKFVILIDFSNSDVSGSLTSPPSGTWKDVSPVGSPGGTTHMAPPNFALKSYDFAVFRSN